MKLIAETPQESKIIDRLSVLLYDLGIITDSFRHDEAIATTFISTDDLLFDVTYREMTAEEQAEFIHSIEDSMRAAMRTAALRAASRALLNTGLGLSHPSQPHYL